MRTLLRPAHFLWCVSVAQVPGRSRSLYGYGEMHCCCCWRSQCTLRWRCSLRRSCPGRAPRIQAPHPPPQTPGPPRPHHRQRQPPLFAWFYSASCGPRVFWDSGRKHWLRICPYSGYPLNDKKFQVKIKFTKFNIRGQCFEVKYYYSWVDWI